MERIKRVGRFTYNGLILILGFLAVLSILIFPSIMQYIIKDGNLYWKGVVIGAVWVVLIEILFIVSSYGGMG